MDSKTLKALRASIKKWEFNARQTAEADMLTGVSDCPLCKLFYQDDCVECPVAKKTGLPRCAQTPYYDVIEADSDEEAVTAALEEVEFLRSLLPKE